MLEEKQSRENCDEPPLSLDDQVRAAIQSRTDGSCMKTAEGVFVFRQR